MLMLGPLKAPVSVLDILKHYALHHEVEPHPPDPQSLFEARAQGPAYCLRSDQQQPDTQVIGEKRKD